MVLIREAQPRDDEALGALLVRAFVETYSRRMPEVEVTEERKADLRNVAARRALAKVLVAELQGVVVGTVAIFPPGAAGVQAWLPKAADLRMLAVDPACHGQGIAAKLLDATERMAEAWEADGICLHIRRGADGLGRFYEARGYQRAPEGDLNRPSVALLGYYRSCNGSAAAYTSGHDRNAASDAGTG